MSSRVRHRAENELEMENKRKKTGKRNKGKERERETGQRLYFIAVTSRGFFSPRNMLK